MEDSSVMVLKRPHYQSWLLPVVAGVLTALVIANIIAYRHSPFAPTVADALADERVTTEQLRRQEAALSEMLARGTKVCVPAQGAAASPAVSPSGASLEIPAHALTAHDISFLNGCWKNTDDLMDTRRHRKNNVKLCFDGAGNGQRIMRLSDGTTCQGNSHAKIDSDNSLVITSDGAACSDGTEFSIEIATCRRAPEGSTACTWSLPSGARVRAHFARD